MKLIDGMKLPPDKYGRVEIPDCSRNDLPQFFWDLGLRVGAEIGVEAGHFITRLCEPGLKVYGIDPWRSYGDYSISQRKLDRFYRTAKEATARFGDNCVLIRKTSMEALADFPDRSLDWVYIDGHHGFMYVTQDVFEWSKKVRHGGIIAGHDYLIIKTRTDNPYVCQVKYVIDAYTQAFKINPWFVLGTKEYRPGEQRDKWRSWMWINP